MTDIDLTGLIDIHIHTAPDIRPRVWNDLDAAIAARDAGMAAILLKSHEVPTAGRAHIAEKSVGGIRVFGGLALNHSVGGLNLSAVEVAIKMGAKEIWMPTKSAANMQRAFGKSDGISILMENGNIRPVVYEILDLIRDTNVILATGHISVKESLALVQAAHKLRLQKILITHPEASFIRMPVETQVEIGRNCVFFERCLVDTTKIMNFAVDIAGIADCIRRVGTNSTVLSTDFGLSGLPTPVEGMRSYLSGLLTEGIRWQDLRCMAKDNPAYLLDL